MAELAKPLVQEGAERKDDEALRQEARAHFEATPPLQLVAELLTKLRTLDLPWWAPDKLRARWPGLDRFRWFTARPDLRQQITTQLTGLARKAARKKTPDFQAALVDSVVDEGDVTASHFEDAFDPIDLVVYGPADAMWRAFVELMPWETDSAVHQELVAWLLEALLTDKGSLENVKRKPILSSWDVRTSISGRVWHQRLPLDVRVAIDDARMQHERERPGQPFNSTTDLAIATPHIIATNIPLVDLKGVFATAERAMGFSLSRPGPKPEGPRTEASPRAFDAQGTSRSSAEREPSREPSAVSSSVVPTHRKSTPPPPAVEPSRARFASSPPVASVAPATIATASPVAASVAPSSPPPASVGPRTTSSARPPAQTTTSASTPPGPATTPPGPATTPPAAATTPAPPIASTLAAVTAAAAAAAAPPVAAVPPVAATATPPQAEPGPSAPVPAAKPSETKISTRAPMESENWEDGESTNPWLSNPMADEESTSEGGARKKRQGKAKG